MSKAWRGGSTRSWRKLRGLVLARDGWLCQIQSPGCTTHATHVDHVITREHGGLDHPSNLRAACEYCNTSRRDTDVDRDPAPISRTRW